MLGIELPTAEREAAKPKHRDRDDDPRKGVGEEGGPVVELATDKPTAQVQAGARAPDSASAPQPSLAREPRPGSPEARRVRQAQRLAEKRAKQGAS
jgi:hypothetical protein